MLGLDTRPFSLPAELPFSTDLLDAGEGRDELAERKPLPISRLARTECRHLESLLGTAQTRVKKHRVFRGKEFKHLPSPVFLLQVSHRQPAPGPYSFSASPAVSLLAKRGLQPD